MAVTRKLLGIGCVALLMPWDAEGAMGEQRRASEGAAADQRPQPAAPAGEDPQQVADWSRVEKVTAAVAFHYTTHCLMKGLPLLVVDELLGRTWELSLQLQRDDRIYATSAQRAHILVETAASSGELVVLDYEIAWQPDPDGLEQAGIYQVAGVDVWQVGDRPRYRYQRRGSLWQRSALP